MIQIRGSLESLLYKSKLFFKNAQYFHIVLAVCMFGTGIAAVVLSYGSDGDAKVPYFFSAFITAAWHCIFIVLCHVCMKFLSGPRSHGSKASALVQAYSVVCSVFVLFNVMGVVFTVVNGICIESMECYYDKNDISNRFMAILLILEHCISILASVYFAKRTHVIDSELSADTSIRLNHHFDYLQIRTHKHSSSSMQQSETSRSQQTTPSDNQNEPELSKVQSKGGHVLTTIEISAMSHKKTHRRSKSQPINFKQLGLNPQEIEGHMFSIYSDSEMKVKAEDRKKKRRFVPSKPKGNRVTATIKITAKKRVRSKSVGHDIDEDSTEDSLSSYGTPRLSVKERKQQLDQLENLRKTTAPLSADSTGEADDILYVKPAPGAEPLHIQQELLERQARLQKEQEKLFAEQRKLFQVQQLQTDRTTEHHAPPPYKKLDSLEQQEPAYSETTLQIDDAEDRDISL